jgi:hypothetical protein
VDWVSVELGGLPIASGLHSRLGIRQSGLFLENFFNLRAF